MDSFPTFFCMRTHNDDQISVLLTYCQLNAIEKKINMNELIASVELMNKQSIM